MHTDAQTVTRRQIIPALALRVACIKITTEVQLKMKLVRNIVRQVPADADSHLLITLSVQLCIQRDGRLSVTWRVARAACVRQLTLSVSKRSVGKTVSEMTYFVSSGTLTL